MLSSTLIVLLWVSPLELTQTRTLELDLERSEISFHASHIGFLSVKGTFRAFEATMSLVNGKPVSVRGSIQVGSIDTDEPNRDETLLGEGYLNAAVFPNIHFQSTSVSENDSGHLISGILHLKSEKRSLSIPSQVQFQGEGSVVLQSNITLNRSHFNLHFGAMDALIGEEVQVEMLLWFN